MMRRTAALGLLAACTAGYVPTHTGTRPLTRASSLIPRLVMQQQRQQDRKALVHRGGLFIGIGPHVQAASLLMRAVVDFCLSFRSRPAASGVCTPSTPPRTCTPMFLNGTLCERITDDDSGDEFCLCLDPISLEDYSCRKVARDGRWMYYCNKLEPPRRQDH